MKLTGKQVETLISALLDAFRSRASLSRMVRVELEESLDEIAAEKDLTDAVYTLIEWGEANDRLGDLIDGACKSNPGNVSLASLHSRMIAFLKSEKANELPPVYTPRIGKRTKLTPEEEEAFLTEFENWEAIEIESTKIAGGFTREFYRAYEFPTFELAFEYMSQVVEQGVLPLDHHPRWQNTYNRVEVWLSTFNSEYKPSTRDVQLAQICEQIWNEFRNKRF